MAETSGHVLMRACNVKSPEGGCDEYVADALPQNMEASNVAREAPVLDSVAVNGVNALEASLASESAGVFYISLCVLHTRQVRTHALHSETRRHRP